MHVFQLLDIKQLNKIFINNLYNINADIYHRVENVFAKCKMLWDLSCNRNCRFDWLAQLLKLCYRCGGLSFDFQIGHIGHSVANGSPPLRRFIGAVLRRR